MQVVLVGTRVFVYDGRMAYVIVSATLFLLFLGWNIFLWGYRDSNRPALEPHPQQVFDPRCRPIFLVHEPPADKALIMVHGFPSTPHTYGYAASRAFAEGYDVFVPLLPGFGTKPEDLYHTTFSQWYGYLARFYQSKRGQYRFLGVIGTSMGGAMTLRLGEDFSDTPQAPDALVTVAAPLFINSLRDRVVKRWSMYIMRTVALFTPALSPDIHWGGTTQNDGEEIWIGYRGTFVRAGLSLVYAFKGIRRDLAKITCPLLSFHDRNDGTVPYANLKVIASHVRAKPFKERTVEMQANHNRHVLLMYVSVQKQLLDEIIEFCESSKQANR
jgi:carboxylesterase